MARLFLPRFIRELNDALSRTPVRDRYWLWGGALLGWARWGRLLPHDVDADFGYFAADRDALLAALPALERAGYRLSRTFRRNDGRITELVLTRAGLRFDFFELEPEDTDRARYWVYGWGEQITCSVPWNGLTRRRFLGRSWWMPTDFDAFLTSIYGDWRTPNPAWNCMLDDRATIAREPWSGRSTPARDAS